MRKKYILRTFSGLLALMLLVIGIIGVTPAQAAATKIMFLGDSITGNPGCWRALLWTRLQSSGFTNIDFVGTQPPQGCGVPYDGDSEGHGGILATNMADQNQLPPWLAATTPDIVVMLLGTNDVWSGRAPSVILTAFSKLVDQMRANNPNVKIIVGQILPMNPSGCSTCAQGAIDFNATIPGWASSKTTAQSPIIVVDQWTGFNTATDTGDGVHPNDAGNQKISDKWYPALSGLLSPGSVTNTPTRTFTSAITLTPTRTLTRTLTPAITNTRTRTATRTNTPGITNTRTRTPTRTLTPAITNTPTRTRTPEPTPVSAADLWVSSVITGPQGWTGGCANDLIMGVSVTIRNSGQFTLPAGPFVVDVSGTQQAVSGLAAGASITLWFQRTGSLLVTVDINNSVPELSESNNTFSYTSVTATPPVVCTRTPTPTTGVSLTPTRTPTITLTPTITPTSGTGPTCSPVISTFTAPFTFDGAGNFCWQSTNPGAYVNSWNLDSLKINGIEYKNQYIPYSSFPPAINGYWYVNYVSSVAWGHVEFK